MQIKQLYNKPLVFKINRAYFSRNITVNCMNSKTKLIHLEIHSENKCSKNDCSISELFFPMLLV